MNNILIISGQRIQLKKLDRHSVKGVWLDAVARYSFWSGQFQGEELLVLVLKQGCEPYTPAQCRSLSDKLKETDGRTAVFYFESLDFNRRGRMVAQGAYFVVGEKYAYLPTILVTGRCDVRPKAVELSTPAQYILLFHLQMRNLNGLSAKEMEHFIPYKYVTLTLAMHVLSDLGICKISTDDNRTRRLCFNADGRALYDMVKPLLRTPVRKHFFCDDVVGDFDVAGINALSRYSMLASETMQTVAIDERQFNTKTHAEPFIGMNGWDGPYKVEVWKYPPLAKDGVVDKISLALSLAHDEDPRVQKELKQMIEKLW